MAATSRRSPSSGPISRAPPTNGPARCAWKDVAAEDYDALFLPGGHGPMEDLADNPALGRVLTAAYDAGKPVAALCHGPVRRACSARTARMVPGPSTVAS